MRNILKLTTKNIDTRSSTLRAKRSAYLQKKDNMGKCTSKRKKLFHNLGGDVERQVGYHLQKCICSIP